MNKQEFKMGVEAKKESEWLIPFDDLDMNLTPFADVTDPEVRQTAIGIMQDEMVNWCMEIPGCNWSVGYVDDAEQNAMVIKWWFRDDDYPVKHEETTEEE